MPTLFWSWVYGVFLNSLCLPVAYSKIKEKAGLKAGENQSYIFHIQPKQIWENSFWSQRLNETLLIHSEPISTFLINLTKLFSRILWQNVEEYFGKTFWRNVLAEYIGRTLWHNALTECLGRMLWQNVLAERFGLWSFSDLESVALLPWDYIEWQKCISSCICLCSMLIYLQSRTC